MCVSPKIWNYSFKHTLVVCLPCALNLSDICSPACTRCLCSIRFNLAVHLACALLTRSLLRGAEQMGMHKAVKPQFGGGMRRFSCEEDNIYENIESELCFFTSQVRAQNCGPCDM